MNDLILLFAVVIVIALSFISALGAGRRGVWGAVAIAFFVLFVIFASMPTSLPTDDALAFQVATDPLARSIWNGMGLASVAVPFGIFLGSLLALCTYRKRATSNKSI